jgi:HEAT repeat protein
MRWLAVIAVVGIGFGCGGEKKKGKEYTSQDLIATLKDPDPNMRYWAARELGKAKGSDAPAAVTALTNALTDQDANVRMGAAYALGDLGPEAKSALPAIRKATKDPAKEVREGAEYATKRIEGRK